MSVNSVRRDKSTRKTAINSWPPKERNVESMRAPGETGEEVEALISDNSRDGDATVFTDESVKRGELYRAYGWKLRL